MIAPLVTNSDYALSNWQGGDQSTFLEMAAAEVRKYCGWHIAPGVTETSRRLFVGEKGLVMLRSAFVTEITSVTVNYENPVTLQPYVDYTWQEPRGWFRLHPQSVPWSALVGGAWREDPHCFVTYNHGYTETPPDVKAVV